MDGQVGGQVQGGVGCQVHHPAVCPAVYLVEECQVDGYVEGQVQVEGLSMGRGMNILVRNCSSRGVLSMSKGMDILVRNCRSRGVLSMGKGMNILIGSRGLLSMGRRVDILVRYGGSSRVLSMGRGVGILVRGLWLWVGGGQKVDKHMGELVSALIHHLRPLVQHEVGVSPCNGCLLYKY